MQDALVTSAKVCTRQLRASAMDRQREGGSSEEQAVGWLKQLDSTWQEWTTRVVSGPNRLPDSCSYRLTAFHLRYLVATPCICLVVPRPQVYPQQGWTAFHKASPLSGFDLPAHSPVIAAQGHYTEHVQIRSH
jgi:hypothetical protein